MGRPNDMPVAPAITSLTPCTPDVSCHCSSFSFAIAQCEPGEFHGIEERARVLDRPAGDRMSDVRVTFDQWSSQKWRTSWMVAAGFSKGTR